MRGLGGGWRGSRGFLRRDDGGVFELLLLLFGGKRHEARDGCWIQLSLGYDLSSRTAYSPSSTIHFTPAFDLKPGSMQHRPYSPESISHQAYVSITRTDATGFVLCFYIIILFRQLELIANLFRFLMTIMDIKWEVKR